VSERNLEAIATQIAQLEDRPLDMAYLDTLLKSVTSVEEAEPRGYIGGIDSSDNLLLNIPEHPGAAVAGYSFALIIANPSGQILFERKRLSEQENDDYLEELEIATVYNVPGREQQRSLRMAEYQLRSMLPMPRTRSPYHFDELMPELKVRLMAARQRELTERRALMTALFQRELVAGVSRLSLLLKDGRLSAQNVQPAFMDEVGRSAVERGVRLVGVVKQGTTLWSLLYPYHKAIFSAKNGPYWTLVPPPMILEAYQQEQVEPKTIRLGAQENRSLGGIGGAWIIYGNSPRSFYILEFNLYDLAAYRPLVRNSMPLELHSRREHGWNKGTFVVEETAEKEYRGTQTTVIAEDCEQLIAPTVNEIHYLAKLSLQARNYPLVLADAHNRCKITQDRKKRINRELMVALQRMGFHAVDFETWNEDPHKIFER
jgi:hypothetical protein